MSISPFQIDIDKAILEDLRSRLLATRWPDQLDGSDWIYGTNVDYLKELVSYWINEFDWFAQQKMLNNFQHFTTIVEGHDVHFIKEDGKGPKPMPLVITHGWPSTILEMYKIIPMLADPASYGGSENDSFDVIAPSLPGYGFSGKPLKAGMDVEGVAALWTTLMTDNLGYSKFASHGGDIGAGVTSQLGRNHADKLIGIHLTSVTRPDPYLGEGSRPLTLAEKAHVAQRQDWQDNEGGYAHVHGTKPQTLSYGLNDSPAGLAAWIVEKYRTWSDCAGDVEKRFSKNELLTNITIYWATQTINTSVRMYYENRRNNWVVGPKDKVQTPTGVAIFPFDLATPPREWAERSYDIRSWTEMPQGGHFAAMEEPELLVEDIRSFFRPLR